MAYSNFKPTIWSKFIQTEKAKETIFAQDCDYTFQGDVGKGKTVKITGVARPTIGDYTGASIGSPETVADSSIYLLVDQAKYFNFAVDDVDDAQSIDGVMQTLMSESTKALAEEQDEYIASLAVNAGAFSASTEVTTTAQTKALVDDAFTELWSNNVSMKDKVTIYLTPWFYTLFKSNITELMTDNKDMINKGIVGMYNNAPVKMSNSLYNDGTDDYMIIKTSKAVACADGIKDTEAYRPEGTFSDAVKGLHTYGAKVVRPKEMYVIKARAGTLSI